MNHEKKYVNQIKILQASEILENHVYSRIAKGLKKEKDKETLLLIAKEEANHYNIWKQYTECDVKPNMFLVFWYVFLAKLLGYTFTIKLMEKNQDRYNSLISEDALKEVSEYVPGIVTIFEDEQIHEDKLIEMIDEDKLQYVGSMVLGLNDALVEFTGSLAGWSFAMQSNKLIFLAGLITGISATLSMASSEYLSSKSDGDENALKSAGYTGLAYLLTVVILLLPYMLLPDDMYVAALGIMLAFVIIIIAAFNYYISVAKNVSFLQKFKEMSVVSLSVAAISFVIGVLVKQFLGIDI
jgi:VIT1/CCC1 family predicted Fe2+/Mn2+ transporter